MNETTITMKEVLMQGITETKSFGFTTESEEIMSVAEDGYTYGRIQIDWDGANLLNISKEDAKKLAYCLEQLLD